MMGTAPPVPLIALHSISLHFIRTESVVAETGGNDVWTGFLLSSFTAGLLSESLLGFLAALLLLDSFSLPEGVAEN
jgi:hypothetical protein